MAPATHVALIRGINVGGRNIVPMAALRESLGSRGLAEVRTYIQSGNVVVSAADATTDSVQEVVETALAEDFDVVTPVMIVTAETLRAAVDGAPTGFADDPETYLCDVAFLREGVDSADAVGAFGVREGVDEVWAGDGVVYFRRLAAERSKSRMSNVTKSPRYQDMTIRNWRTTTTLLGMLDA